MHLEWIYYIFILDAICAKMTVIDIPYIYNNHMVMNCMRVAVIGSRGLQMTGLDAFLPANTTQIISGGAKGVDTCVRNYALVHGIRYALFLPDYKRYGKGAPLKRNEQIVSCAELVIAFWDGKSRGTKYTIDLCKQRNVPVEIHILQPASTLA